MTLQQTEVGGKVFILNNYDTDAFLSEQNGVGTVFL
jgi:hypothetical protein